MRAHLRHPATWISLAALLVALELPSYAASLIDGKRLKRGTVTSRALKDGGVAERDLTTAVRTKLNAPGPQGPPGTALACSDGLILIGAECLEPGQRPDAPHVAAQAVCRGTGGHLPSVELLQLYQLRVDAPNAGTEWAGGAIIDLPSTEIAFTVRFTDGLGASTDITGAFPYRCAYPAPTG